MPEFQLDTFGEVEAVTTLDGTKRAVEFRDLDSFTQGYIECIFFTNQSCIPMTDWADEESQEAVREGTADGELPNDAGFSDLHPDSLASIIADCDAFQTANAGALALAYARDGYSEIQAGRDFCFTRNGHGVGFWDRDALDPQGEEWDALQRPLDTWTAEERALFDKLRSESLGTILTDAAHACGEINVSFGDAADGLESPTGYGWVFVE